MEDQKAQEHRHETLKERSKPCKYFAPCSSTLFVSSLTFSIRDFSAPYLTTFRNLLISAMRESHSASSFVRHRLRSSCLSSRFFSVLLCSKKE